MKCNDFFAGPLRGALACVAAVALMTGCRGGREAAEEQAGEPEPVPTMYGIEYENYTVVDGEVAPGETMGKILNGFGVSAAMIDRIDKASLDIFPLRNVRAGNRYTAFLENEPGDTLGASRRLCHLVYEKNLTDYITFTLHGDSVVIASGQKDVRVERFKKSAVINSSLWGAIMEEELPYALAAELEDIFGSTVDFFGIQKGDNFTVIYEQKYVDTLSVGIGRIWGAVFEHGGKQYTAIPFRQNGKVQFFEPDGASLRKQLLKAPLKYTRISSRFTRARLHPIYKVYRPHTGVDYAAPSGTPVHSVADGVVISKGWAGGGGNTVKIKHANNLTSGYMHLRGYAKGLAVGSRVSQGQLIGYVGSTGSSTGPHLDFRLWKGGTPIDPLKAVSPPAEPVSAQNKAAFEHVAEWVKAELAGESDPRRVTQIDSAVWGVVLTPAAVTADSTAAERTK